MKIVGFDFRDLIFSCEIYAFHFQIARVQVMPPIIAINWKIREMFSLSRI